MAQLSSKGPDDFAIGVVRQWTAARFPFLGRQIGPAVTSVQWQSIERLRAAHTIRTRRIELVTAAVPRKVAPIGSLPEPSAFDPWASDVDAALASTRTIATCPRCHGSTHQTCDACEGTPDRPCSTCGGSGRAVSSRSGRFIKCQTCRGAGRKRCACRDGVVTCAACLGKGVVTAWLTVRETERVETKVAGFAAFVASYGGDEVEDNVGRSSFSVHAPEQLRGLPHAEALQLATDARTERLVAIHVTRETSSLATVSYTLAGRDASVDLESWTGRVTPRPSSEEPFLALRRRLCIAAVAALIAGLLLANWFAARHWYYRESAAAGVLSLLAFLAPFAVAPVVIDQARSRLRRTWAISLRSLLPCLAIVGTQVALVATTTPSIERAKALAATTNHQAALNEARAAAELGIRAPEARTLHDEQQTALLKAATSPTAAWERLAHQAFLTTDGRQRAEAAALEWTVDAVGEALRGGDPRRSLQLLHSVPTALRDSTTVRKAETAARAASVVSLWRVVQTDGPLRDRLAACATLDAEAKPLALEGALPMTLGQISSACASVAAVERERARAEQAVIREAERRQRERAARARQRATAEARRRDAEARAWTYAPLLCRDGSLSPTCVCGGSRRGCCSHHGGVAGCSR